MSTRMVHWEHCHTGINTPLHCALITCSKAVLDLEANPLQLFVTEEADPHESPAGEDESRTGRATEAIDEWREAEGAVPHLDVVETTLKWRLDVEGLIKQKLYPLAGQSWGKHSGVSRLLPQRLFKYVMPPQSGQCSEKIFDPFKFSPELLIFLQWITVGQAPVAIIGRLMHKMTTKFDAFFGVQHNEECTSCLPACLYFNDITEGKLQHCFIS